VETTGVDHPGTHSGVAVDVGWRLRFPREERRRTAAGRVTDRGRDGGRRREGLDHDGELDEGRD